MSFNYRLFYIFELLLNSKIGLKMLINRFTADALSDLTPDTDIAGLEIASQICITITPWMHNITLWMYNVTMDGGLSLELTNLTTNSNLSLFLTC